MGMCSSKKGAKYANLSPTFLHDPVGVTQSGFRNREKFGCGIRNTAQGIWNPNNAWKPESKFYWQRLESNTRNLESKAWNPESKTVLDFLKQGESASTILQETDQVDEDFSLDYGNQELTLNNKIGNLNLPATQFNNKESVEFSYFWKMSNQG